MPATGQLILGSVHSAPSSSGSAASNSTKAPRPSNSHAAGCPSDSELAPHPTASRVTLDAADLDALLALAQARTAADAQAHAGRFRALLGPSAALLEPHITALLAHTTELQQMNRLAMTDALTGVANRRALGDALRRELARAERSGKPLALLMLDVDNFKAINDMLGHAAGDNVLRVVARCSRLVTREADLVARVGGDEFAIMLPETESEAARSIAERIRAGIAHASDLGPQLQVSVGLAVTSSAGTSAVALLAASDKDLYRDKATRKSRRDADADEAPSP